MTTLTAKVLADFTTSLASALAIGATTATLQSATDDDGVALPSGQYYFTLDGSNSSKEHIRCTLSGTSLTSIYSISRQGVATSGTVRAHRLGATVTLTDFAHIKVINDLINGTTSLDSSNPLKYDGVADMIGDTNKLATVKYVNDTAIAGAPDSSTTTKGIVKMSTAPASATEPIAVGTNDTRVPTQDENDALAGTSGTPSSTNKYVTNDDTVGSGKIYRNTIKFGGTGVDGALSITSGTTNIDLGGAQVFVKNYTSISITGTGALTFTNPHANGTIVVLRSQGDVTITSSATRAIDMRSIGAASVAQNTAGKIGTSLVTQMTAAQSGNNATNIGGIGVGYGNLGILNKSLALYCGSSGGGAQSGASTTSGSGAGCLYIECAGYWNVTGTIDLSGGSVSANTNSPGANITWYPGGGGASFTSGGNGVSGGTGNAYGNAGGGGGGVFVGLYNFLTANSGTYTISGGTSASGGNSIGGGAGGNGYSLVTLNTEFI